MRKFIYLLVIILFLSGCWGEVMRQLGNDDELIEQRGGKK